MHRSADRLVLEAGMRLLGYVALMGNAVLVKKIGGWYLREDLYPGVEETRSNLTSSMTYHDNNLTSTACFFYMFPPYVAFYISRFGYGPKCISKHHKIS